MNAAHTPARLGRPALWMLLGVLCAQAMAQPLPNGSFEDGLNGWTPGFTGRVESLMAAAFTGNPPTVPDGAFVALLSTGPGDAGGALVNVDGNGVNDDDAATLDTTLQFDFAPAALRFEWAFATSEQDQPDQFDDTFGLILNSQFVFTRSVNKPGGSSPFPDTPAVAGPAITIASNGVTDNSSFIDGRTGFFSECVNIPGAVNGPNSITARFFVADQGDAVFDSGLLLDNVRLDSSCAPPGEALLQQLTVTAKELPLAIKNGAPLQRLIQNRRAAASSDGSVVAFISKADLTGDNPFHIDQVFSFANGAFRRESAFTNGCLPPGPCEVVQDLDISRDGRWIAVAARATGGDNLEIFRIDRNSGNVQQITATAGCDNQSPSINGNGSRIAFQSNCPDFLTLGGSNLKMVLWDNGGFIDNNGLPDCRDHAPEVSGANNGRFTAFASTCDHGGLNPAGEQAVFRFDKNGIGNFQRVDDPGPAASDVVDINRNGNLIVYVAMDTQGTLSAFRRAVNQPQAEPMNDSDPLLPVVNVRIIDENDGNDLLLERLDLHTTDSSALWHVDAGASPPVLTPVVTGSLDGGFSISRDGGVRLIHFASGDDLTGQNAAPDGNPELFQARIEP